MKLPEVFSAVLLLSAVLLSDGQEWPSSWDFSGS